MAASETLPEGPRGGRAASRAHRGTGVLRRCALGLLPLAAGQQHEVWPACQERGSVLRHDGRHGVFTDLAHYAGAREGCWLSDCSKTDKFVCPSPAECGAACAKVEGCEFWTYEPGIRKCFLRHSDGGREASVDFVSGAKGCRPGGPGAAPAAPAAAAAPPPSDVAGASGPAAVGLPFAAAALWAAELPAIRPCDSGIGAPGCDNPYAVMGVWRYAVNNLRLAISYLPASERAQHKSTLAHVSQLSQDLAGFYRQPTAESFQVVVSNALAIFGALGGWLRGAAPAQVDLRADHRGAPHLPGGASAKLKQDAAGLAGARASLADGRPMPLVGFGTWQIMGQQCYDATLAALQAGYRHIDTAQAYGNEREVGLAIQSSGVPRQELFIATKISDPDEYGALEKRLEAQLAALSTDYLDLYMLHSPGDDKAGREAAWRTMESLHAQGKVRSLGVSNFGVAELQELLSFARVRPVYLQNKFSVYSPGEQQVGKENILAFAREHNIQVMGYSVINPWPLMLPPMEDPHVRAVAGRVGKSPAQVLHRWALQLGVAVIPKSATPARIAQNAQILDFELSELDMRLLSGLVALGETVAGGTLSPAWADDVYGINAVAL